MSFQLNPYPEWSWSKSRNDVFKECLLKYYYQYYGSHNGWHDEASEEAKKLYRLKQLKNLYFVFGEAVHDSAKYSIKRWLKTNQLPNKEDLEDMVTKRLRKACKDSIDKDKWWAFPKEHYMLQEIYYEGKLPEDRVNDIKDRILLCTENFLENSVLNKILTNDAINLIEVDELNHFFLDDKKIYVKLDLLYEENSKFVVVDWKTGKEVQDNLLQLFIYALYLVEQYHIPPEQIEIRTEYLTLRESNNIEVTEEDIWRVKEIIKESNFEMEKCLEDIDINKPKPFEYFRDTPSKGVCSNCNFRGVCDKAECK